MAENGPLAFRSRRAGETGDDAVIPVGIGCAFEADTRSRMSRQLAIFRRHGGEEYQWFDEGHPGFSLDHRCLSPQQARQPFGLSIRQYQWVVVGMASAIRLPGPGMRIAGHRARTTFYLHQKQSHGRKNQGIHLVDFALFVDELEV